MVTMATNQFRESMCESSVTVPPRLANVICGPVPIVLYYQVCFK